METKIVKHSNVLLYGFSFHLILTLGSLGFTCYSLNRLDSRLTAIEQNLMLKSTPYQHANGATIKITSENAPGSGWKTTDQIVKRDISSPSICSKCRTVCSNSNTQQNVALDLKVHQALAVLVDQQVPRDLPVEKEEKEQRGHRVPKGSVESKDYQNPPENQQIQKGEVMCGS